MKDQSAKREHYPSLDGLRGIGCLLVVVYHNFWFFHQYLFFGWLAMDIFFVLSGFLITDILIKTAGRTNYLKNFYVRRVLRVFPLYYLSLILFIWIVPHLTNALELGYFAEHQGWFWTFLQNWVLISRPAGGQNVLGHLWSMGVEEQFYLLWPLVFALVRNPKTLLWTMAAILIAFSAFRVWIWIEQIPGISYYQFFLLTRIDGICIGCMVALMQKIDARFIGKHLALIVLAFAGFNFLFYYINLKHGDSIPYLGLLGFSTFSMIFGLLVYEIVNREHSIFSKMLDIRFLKFLGRISYGTYIFHWPLYLLLVVFMPHFFTDSFGHQLMVSLIATVLAFIVGHLSFRYFESYFLALKKHFK
jgi:peptidoglycan/LPS O-acetylase OafA/YrhL